MVEHLSVKVREASDDVLEAILCHPFLTQLADGSLPKSAFGYFLREDGHYVDNFAQCLSALAAKAPNAEWRLTLLDHARASMEAEKILHAVLLKELNLPATNPKSCPSPTTLSYASYLTSTCHVQPFATGLVSLFPCYWIYGEVARELAKLGSIDPIYQIWINNYSGSDYADTVSHIVEMIDVVGGSLDQSQADALAGTYGLGSRFELMFWDAAFREESWPLEGTMRRTIGV